MRRDGEVSGVVVESGGLLGIGSKEVMVPWSQLQPMTSGDDQTLTLSMENDQFARLRPYGGADSLANESDLGVMTADPGSARPAE